MSRRVTARRSTPHRTLNVRRKKNTMITPKASFVVQKWIRGYEKGIYTHMEVVCALVHAAATYAPGDLAAAMPPEWLEKVRQDSANPPRSPADGVYLGSALLRAGASYEEWEAEMSRKW